MSGQTPFAGLEYLDPTDVFSADGFRFQQENPALIDRLLKIGAISHRHDAHAALPNPAVAPAVTQAAVGGTIPANTAIHVVHTWVDKDGGETAPSPVGTINTPEGLLPPAKAPTLAVDYTAGVLLAGGFTYAVTVTDGVGGETQIGPSAAITVDPGHAKARVKVSGLKVILEEVAPGLAEAKWRLWRQQEGGPWYLMGTGTEAELTDDGSLAGDCTVEPPRSSTTRSTNQVKIVVPAAPAGSEFFRLYISDTEEFLSPALIAQYPLSEIGKTIVVNALAPVLGQPPLVTTSYPGANKINGETDILNFHWKPPVNAVGELPAVGNEVGDVRFVSGQFEVYAWSSFGGGEWVNISARHFVTTHTFALRGPVVAEPAIPPHEVEMDAEGRQLTTLIAVRYKIIAGTSMAFRIQKNGVDVPGLGTAGVPLLAKTEKKRTTVTGEVELKNGDDLAPVIGALVGEPAGASISLVMAHLLLS